MYAYYTYKPTVAGMRGKMPNIEELLTQKYADATKVTAYIHEHRKMAHLLQQQASSLRPILEGQSTAEPSPRELLEAYLANARLKVDVTMFVTGYFESISQCMRSKPELSPFGKPPTEAQKQEFFERYPLLEDKFAPHGVLVRHEGSSDTLYVVAGAEAANALAAQYEFARVIPVSQP